MEIQEIRKLFEVLKNQKIHIILKNEKWFNGTVSSVIDGDYVIFEEFKLGMLPISLNSIAKIEKWRER
jgi:hypothetical protein